MRIDKYLVEEGYFESRNRALDAIKNGKVMVDGKIAKPSVRVDSNTTIEIADTKFYVSRAARKLESFLLEYPIEMVSKRALDIGSSTGGFAQILLGQGVSELSCVDVGREQLHHTLREDSRVKIYEETDIREFSSEIPFDLISCDVSFISILYIIESIDRLAVVGCDIIILYKPQFEVGKSVRRDSRGVVLDLDAVNRKREEFEAVTAKIGWRINLSTCSKVIGKEGNQEYIYHFVKEESTDAR